MMNHGENGTNPNAVNEFSVVVMVIKIVILAIFLVPLAKYSMVSKQREEFLITDLAQNMSRNESEELYVMVRGNESGTPKFLEKVVKRPSCPRSYLLIILRDICADLFIKHEFCTPEDFFDENKHQIPKKSARNNSKDMKAPTIINYVIGGLLMTSLGAALLEFYKAKRQPKTDNSKSPLSRKCSLADLTVMKHHRKELVRRESLLEVPEGRETQLGFKPQPLKRRCSFPVNASIATNDSARHVPYIDGKPVTVLDSRRTSVDLRSVQLDGRRVSVSEQGSPERRHHSRLVHRH